MLSQAGIPKSGSGLYANQIASSPGLHAFGVGVAAHPYMTLIDGRSQCRFI